MGQVVWEKLKVVVIDDEPHIRRIIYQLLRRLDVSAITEAKDGKSGFMEVVRHRPHIVLCDINMEPVDGMKFLANLRRTSVKEVADTPVIFLTADAQQETVVRATQLQVNGYLVKPVSLNDLKTRISAVITDMTQDLSHTNGPKQ